MYARSLSEHERNETTDFANEIRMMRKIRCYYRDEARSTKRTKHNVTSYRLPEFKL